MENFVPALAALRNAKPDDLLNKLHGMFMHIARMNANEVVAAYQTVKGVAEEMRVINDPMVQRMLKAMVAQMKAITHSGYEGGQNVARFAEVTDLYPRDFN